MTGNWWSARRRKKLTERIRDLEAENLRLDALMCDAPEPSPRTDVPQLRWERCSDGSMMCNGIRLDYRSVHGNSACRGLTGGA